MENLNEIVSKLIEAKKAYYFTEMPILSDSDFDKLEDYLKEIDPSNSYFSLVGSEFSGQDKIIHKYPMLSMGKAKNSEDMNKWFKKLNLPGIEYCLQPKIDGLSATCRYKNGRLIYVATRGDGNTGQDISHISHYMKDIKKQVNFSLGDVEVRGELYLPKNTPYDTKGKALRNNCVGLINRKENREDLKYVRFVAYQIAGDHSIHSEGEKIKTLSENGFHTVEFSVLSTGKDIGDYYKDYLSSKREIWNYETDGIIITVNNNLMHEEIDSRWVVDHHHHYNIAFKPPSEGKETKLKNIEWQVSRQGNVIPVAIFDPIHIGGAKLERATLHNYSNVLDLKLEINDTLYVERANDVIPYVKENRSIELSRDESCLIPKKCPSCGNDLIISGVHLKCVYSHCSEVLIQQIIYWVKESGIDGVAEGTLRSLFNSKKINTIKDIYLLKSDDFIGLDGFGDKKISGFIEGVNKVRKMNSIKLLSRLGIPSVQEKSLKKLNIKSIDDFWSFNNIDYVIGQNIITWKENPINVSFLNGLLEVIEIEDVEDSNDNGLVSMTGKGPLSRKEIISIIEEKGWSFSSSITKEVSILLCDNPEGSSSKLVKARKLGIKVVEYNDFINS